MALHAVFMLLAAFWILGTVTPAHADVVQCGDVLGPGGRFTLEQDIVCGPGALAPGVTVRGGAILDLNGHTVDCRAIIGRCVVLTGRGATLLNGMVRGNIHESIVLLGTGRHTLKKVTSLGPVDGNVIVGSDHNTLIDVMAESVISEAFLINGHHNLLWNSIALCQSAATVCVSVDGDGNQLIHNFGRSDTRVIIVSGDNNVLQGNRAILTGASGQVAIGVGGTGNRVTRNTAIAESGIDLGDGNGDCSHNTWQHNIFVTANPACIR